LFFLSCCTPFPVQVAQRHNFFPIYIRAGVGTGSHSLYVIKGISNIRGKVVVVRSIRFLYKAAASRIWAAAASFLFFPNREPGLMIFGAMPPASFTVLSASAQLSFLSYSLFPWCKSDNLVNFSYTRANTLGQNCFFFYIDIFLYYKEIIVRLSAIPLFLPCFTGLEVRTTSGTGTCFGICAERLSACMLKYVCINAACRRWAVFPVLPFSASRECAA